MSSRNLIFDSSSSSSSRSSLILLGSSTSIFSGVKSMVMGAAEHGMESKPLPLFSSPDEIYKEFYVELLPEKRHLTSEQIRILERSFKEENKLEPERKSKLAKRLGLQPRQVAVWFQNRRARGKNKQVEHDYDRLKASYDSLILNHNAARKDNDRLRWQVNFLLEKLQENDQQGTSGVPVPSLDDQAASSTNPMAMALNIQQKVDDLLSTGSGTGTATAVGVEPHLLVEEPFLAANCHKVTLSGAGIPSEDDISDEGCNYHQQQQEMQLDKWLDYLESIFFH